MRLVIAGDEFRCAPKPEVWFSRCQEIFSSHVFESSLLPPILNQLPIPSPTLTQTTQTPSLKQIQRTLRTPPMQFRYININIQRRKMHKLNNNKSSLPSTTISSKLLSQHQHTLYRYTLPPSHSETKINIPTYSPHSPQ